MSTASNPLTGSAWGGTSPFGNQMFQVPGSQSITGMPQGAPGNPAGLDNPGSNIKDQLRNAGFLQVMEDQMRNQMLPQFANQMFGYAGPAGQFFNQLMNLGSPFYQQKQRQSFENVNQQNQNAAGQARDQLNAQGYGATPSGTTAGMIGGMAMGGARTQAEQFLQNLFQNEQLQMGGAQGLSQLAAMFNPAQLFGSNQFGNSTQGPVAAQEFGQVASGVGDLFRGLSGTSLPGVGGGKGK